MKNFSYNTKLKHHKDLNNFFSLFHYEEGNMVFDNFRYSYLIFI